MLPLNLTLPPSFQLSFSPPCSPRPPPPCPHSAHSIYTLLPLTSFLRWVSVQPFLLKQVWHEGRTRRQLTDMAFHIIQAQHSSPVVVVVALVFLLHASAQLELDYLGRGQWRQLPISLGFEWRGTKKKKEKRCIYLDENNVTKHFFHFIIIRRRVFFIRRNTCSFYILYIKNL